MDLIDWESNQSRLFSNPKETVNFPELPMLDAHLFVSTSGTLEKKWVGLSKEGFLLSAQSVNDHLTSDAKDEWVHPLPDFHVGGLGIYARAHLSGAKVHKLNHWDPVHFHRLIGDKKGTLTACVPTQVYDLVAHQLESPPTLRAVIVGGAALPATLYQKGRELGWPLLPSYGLSECGSQVATASLISHESETEPPLIPLPHVQVKCDADGTLMLKSRSLLTAYLLQDGSLIDPKKNGWLVTEDLGELRNGSLILQGRKGETVKINGELVSLSRLNRLLGRPDCYLTAYPHPRKGYEVHLVTTLEDARRVVETFNAQVLPFERVQFTHRIETIPRNALGKVDKKSLDQLISAK